MPYLPISPALTNPMLLDTFTVTQRTETVDDRGRSSIAEAVPISAFGTVTPASANQLERLSDYDLQRDTISIITTFALSTGGVPNRKADWVTWDGDTYEVLDVQSYQRYGLGFTQVTAGIITLPSTP